MLTHSYSKMKKIKQSIFDYEREIPHFKVSAKIGRKTRCKTCIKQHRAGCNVHTSSTKEYFVNVQGLDTRYTAVIPGVYCSSYGNSTRNLLNAIDHIGIADGEIISDLNLVKVNSNLFTAELVQFLNDKTISDKRIGPKQWYDIVVFHTSQKIKSESDKDPIYSYVFTNTDILKYAQTYVTTIYYFELLFWGLYFYSWYPRSMEWKQAIYRMGGDTITIDGTFHVEHLYASQDCFNADDTSINIYDKRKQQKPVDVGVLVGLNKYHFEIFTNLLPHKSEAQIFIIPPIVEYWKNMVTHSEKPCKGFNIATDGLKGSINLHTRVAYAIKHIHQMSSYRGIDIDEQSKLWTVCTIIYLSSHSQTIYTDTYTCKYIYIFIHTHIYIYMYTGYM